MRIRPRCINAIDWPVMYHVDMRAVRCFGTEGRPVNGPAMPPSAQVFDMVVFKGMHPYTFFGSVLLLYG